MANPQYNMKSKGPKIEPCETSDSAGGQSEQCTFCYIVIKEQTIEALNHRYHML